jgi:hypothetical protein
MALVADTIALIVSISSLFEVGNTHTHTTAAADMASEKKFIFALHF